jgi:hypothetical protein
MWVSLLKVGGPEAADFAGVKPAAHAAGWLIDVARSDHAGLEVDRHFAIGSFDDVVLERV